MLRFHDAIDQFKQFLHLPLSVFQCDFSRIFRSVSAFSKFIDLGIDRNTSLFYLKKLIHVKQFYVRIGATHGCVSMQTVSSKQFLQNSVNEYKGISLTNFLWTVNSLICSSCSYLLSRGCRFLIRQREASSQDRAWDYWLYTHIDWLFFAIDKTLKYSRSNSLIHSIKISCPSSSTDQLIDWLKQLNGTRYDGSLRIWYHPPSVSPSIPYTTPPADDTDLRAKSMVFPEYF